MKVTRSKQRSFKVDDYAIIKIDKVYKTTLLRPNAILGKIIHLENDYTKVVTKFGVIFTSTATNRLNKYTRTNITFDYAKETTFSAVSKQPIYQ